MGCASSAALSSGSKVQAIKLPKKDAGSQTSVTVLIPSTSTVRTDARDARKETALLHRTEALNRAKEICNSNSGYTSAAYTGSEMTTPRSTYSRSTKHRGSDMGSVSDGELRSRTHTLSHGLNQKKNSSSHGIHQSRSSLSNGLNESRSSLSNQLTPPQKTKVSFRNDEYNKIAAGNRKRRKSYNYHNNRSARNRVNNDKPSTDRNNSGSSGANSLCRLADTGYEGSVSSVPSSVAVMITKPKLATSTSDIPSPSSGVDIIQTASYESQAGRLSVVVSLEEQSVFYDNPGQEISGSDSGANDVANLAEIPELLPAPPDTRSEQNYKADLEPLNDQILRNDSAVNIKVGEKLSSELRSSESQKSIIRLNGLNTSDKFGIKGNGLTAIG